MNCSVFIQWNYTEQEKRQMIVTWINVDESQRTC